MDNQESNKTAPASPEPVQQPLSPLPPVPPGDNKKHDHSGSWIWGITLIVLGGLFLLQNLGPFRLVNWWAVFILIPALGAFATAWQRYREHGRLTSGSRNALFGGVIFTTVALMFLFNLDLGKFWPIFVIAGGLAILVNALLPD